MLNPILVGGLCEDLFYFPYSKNVVDFIEMVFTEILRPRGD